MKESDLEEALGTEKFKIMPFKEYNQPEDIISASDKKIIDMNFEGGRMLDRDVLNFWPTVMITSKLGDLSELSSIARYEQGYRDVGDNNAKIKYIMRFSDLEQIKKYNELVDEFNADLARIKRENDIDGLKDYIKRATKIVDEIK